ncbi:TetR/AcrR family transcriptional regulator [Sphingomonas sp. PB4P5]|uniref:TetR/AcrR family transcriptional regulator n=1 Tax=Parasphingomonas puruogangriensis TaxID=3096155 RepID=UPI002FC8F4F7
MKLNLLSDPVVERPRTGRPLSFDRVAALDAAMHLFWRHGYEATSIAELTRAMRITPPSLYAAFGDKRRLFHEAVDRYLGGGDAVPALIAAAPSARQAARDLLTAAAIGDTGEETPPGCLLASAIVSSSAAAADVRDALAAIRREIEALLRARIERDVAERRLPQDSDAEMLAGHVMAVVQGMSTLAKDGAGREKLLRIVDSTMAAWPAVVA